jgi:hypothetical protein
MVDQHSRHYVHGGAVHYERRGNHSFKTEEEDHKSALSKVYGQEHYANETKYTAPQEHDHEDTCSVSRKFTHHDDDATKIRSFMSFDSMKTDFGISIESPSEDNRQRQAGYADQTNVLLEDDESILHLLREDLHPIDNMSWRQDGE